MSTKTLVRSANPNAHGRIRLYRFDEGGDFGDTVWVVALPGEHSDDGQEFGTEAEAGMAYDAEVARLAVTPNWEAQAAYDDAHGTDNGYAPFQRMEY